MNIVLVAHGTRAEEGARCARRMTHALQARLPGHRVELAFADVREPDVTEVLRGLPGPTVVLPAFLARGYHVRTDVPAQVAATGRRDVRIAPALGPDPRLFDALIQRLRQAGWCHDLPVVLAVAGSTDRRALSDVDTVANGLARRIGAPVRVAHASGSGPALADVLDDRPTAIATWLLAPGLFHNRIRASGAAVIAEPLGTHPAVVDTMIVRVNAVSLRAAG